MNKKITKLMAALALLTFLAVPMGMWGETTYEQLTSIANIDENAQYVLGIDGTGFHYSGTSSWGLTALPSAQTPIYYTLTKASDGNSFTAKATIGNTTYYLEVPTSNTFSMATSAGTNTDLIIGTTQVSGTNYAVANKTTTARHLRINGTSGLRSYAGTTGTMAFFYKVSGTSMSVSPASIDFGNENTINPNEPYTRTFNVTFANLTENLTVTGFTGVTVSPATINANATSPQTVTVSYNPTTEGSISGNISVNSSEVTEALVAVSGSAYDPANVHYYEKVTEASSNWSGEYIFTGINSNNYYALTGISNNVGTAAQVTVSENGIQSTSTTDGYKVTVAQTTNGYSLYLAGAGYLYFTSTSNNLYAAQTFTANTCEWTFSFANGVATIANVAYNTRILQFNYNNGNPRFACYTSNQIKLTLFKYNDPNQVTPPTFSPEGGICTTAQSVTISSETSGASIYYTTDGSTPTTGSTLFTEAFTVSSTTTVKAIAVKSGMTDSYVASTTYTFVTPFTTMQQVYEDITTNTASHPVAIAFDNWVITGTNGSNPNQFYLTDASNTYGCVIYGSGSGFVLGNTLSGTVMCNAERYTINQKAYPQLTNLSTTTEGLNVGNGGSVTANPTTINQLSGSMTGTVIKLDNLTYNGSYLADENENKIVVSNLIYTNVSLESGKTYNITGVLSWAYSQYGYQRIMPRSAADVEEVISSDPTIYASPASLTGFTYGEGSGPSTAQTITVSGTNLEGNVALALNNGANSAFEISLSESTGYANSLTLTQTSGTVGETTIYVRLKADLSIDAYSDAINLTSTNATTVNVNLAGSVTPLMVTWDLTTATYNSQGTEQVQWTSSFATMTVDKNGASSDANAYLNTGNPVTTRFYNGQKLTFAPKSGYTIDHVEISGTSGNVGGIDNNAWNNATSITSGTTVTITPTDESKPFYDIVSASVRLTSVTVYYAVSADPFYTITIDDDINNGTLVADYDQATEGTIVTLTINPNTGYYLKDSDLMVLDDNLDDVDVTKVNGVTYTFEMPADNVTVYASFSTYTGTYYTLVTSTAELVPGRHYIIASSKTSGSAYAMGAQNSNKYREQVAVDVVNNMIYETENVYEIVLSGDADNYWTLYDDETLGYLHAYNSTSNQLGTRESNATNENYGQWAININEGAANIVSQVGAYGFSNTIKYNSTNTRFSCYTASSTMAPVYLFMKAGETDYELYSNTTCSNLTIGALDIYTVHSPATLEVTGTLTNEGDHENLIIEDGGQLIHSNTDVQATVKKEIGAFVSNGWKMMASPISGDIDFPSNLTTNGKIYKYDEASHYWRYYNGEGAPFTTMTNQTGYLYGNDGTVTLSFAGELVPSGSELTISDLSYTEGNGDLAGWNLVGNPFACNAYANKAYYVAEYDAEAGENVKTKFTAKVLSDAIAPCMGILVKATSEDKAVKFKNSAYTDGSINNGNILLAVAQQVVNRSGVSSVVKDNAIVSFNEDNELAKFVFNEDNAKLYIPQNNKEYAIVSIGRDGARTVSTLPVNFKATEDGTYTITVSTEGVEMNYLHLIDNMTSMDVDLLQTPSYSFEATTSDYESRFRLVFAAAEAANEPGEAFAFFSDGNLIINGTGTLQVIDVMGRVVACTDVARNVSTSGMTPGVYVLRLINGDNVKVQKIVVR